MASHKQGSRYRKHYAELHRRHFVHEECVQLAVVKTLRYTELHRMTSVRQLLWNRFVRRHPELEMGTRQFHLAWRQAVKDWYVDHRLDTFDAKMRRVVSPWSWFDEVSYALPEEMRYTKDHRRKNPRDTSDAETPSARARRTAWIHQLKATLEKYPNRASSLVPQILRLGGKVSTQWRRKAGVA